MAAKLLMIGLDAADVNLIERWTDDGTLPCLRDLRRNGHFGPLASTADWLVGSPWVAFYSGQSPAENGIYHSIVWQPDRWPMPAPRGRCATACPSGESSAARARASSPLMCR